MSKEHLEIGAQALPDLAGAVRDPGVTDLPEGYQYGVTRYADLILKEAFPQQFADLITTLQEFKIELDELLRGGGSKSTMARRFDAELQKRGWGKRTMTVSKLIDGKPVFDARGHEIDMFAAKSSEEPYPGIALEMEWNNKAPFFDRDLNNFAALHREGALAIGVIITRGPELQRIAGPVIKTSEKETSFKYGQSTTHWNKLIPRINLGGGGECPILVIGIEPGRIADFHLVRNAHSEGENSDREQMC
ncbi:hypothetical protein BH23CHL5_BH23CHL5_10160 [soil metagenome]